MEFKYSGLYPKSSIGCARQDSAYDRGLRKVKNTPGGLKILLAMKLTVFLLVVALMQVSAHGLAQRMSYEAKNAPLKKVFSAILGQTGYGVLIDQELLDKSETVSFSVKEATVQEVLDLCFKKQPYQVKYSFYGHTVSVLRVSPEPVSSSNLGDTAQGSPVTIKGHVQDESGKGAAGVNVVVKNTAIGTTTDSNGDFVLTVPDRRSILVFSSVNLETVEQKPGAKPEMQVSMRSRITALSQVSVEYNTGYERLNKKNTTGSVDVIDNATLNRVKNSALLPRIENLTPGLFVNRGSSGVTGDQFLIRGRSSILSSNRPLIVIDNLPYEGSLDNINPEDIESLTVLKDAASAAIYGATAGNGVIVITLKKGNSLKPQVSLNSNITVQGRPDLGTVKSMTSQDYIGFERLAFAQGAYDNNINTTFPISAITPVVGILAAVRNGSLSQADGDAQIANLARHDVKDDLAKYFYRPSTLQQYSINVSGSTPNVNYYLSGGWQHDLRSQPHSNYDRITLRTQNTFKVTKKLEVIAGLSYVQNNSSDPMALGASALVGPAPNGYGHSLYPYAVLADANGRPQSINLGFKQQYIDQASAAGLLDWNYRPLSDLSEQSNATKIRDITVNTGLRYKILPFLSAELYYQYEDQLTSNHLFYQDSSYYARDLINTFTQVDASGSLSYPVPLGGLLLANDNELMSHQGRAQLLYNQRLGTKHLITALGGFEIRSKVTTGNAYNYYGYNPDQSITFPLVNYNTYYPTYQMLGDQLIPNQIGVSKTTDHFLSYYANGSYTYDNRLIGTASAREDQANLFGVKANQKGTPLWSMGAAWIVSNEKFYHSSFLQFLKLRASYGYNGNISRATSAYSTISYRTAINTPTVSASIVNPPNPDLKWERTKIINLGLDFAIKGGVVDGSIEYYRKKGLDLMGQVPADPTLGIGYGSFYYANSANMAGRGIDVQLNSKVGIGPVKWNTTYIFSYNTSKVTDYLLPSSPLGSTYVNLSLSNIVPVIGKPVYGIYSYAWGGLDPTNGDPQGYFGKEKSKDYASIYSQTKLDSMVFSGPVEPTFFGAIRNSFSYKGFTASCNISYKFGYWFRKNEVLNYSGLLNGWNGSSDYGKRWQKPGDEQATNVPSAPSSLLALDNYRDMFYQYSTATALNAGNIRLEDITLSYEVSKKALRNISIQQLRVFIIAQNIARLYLTNKEGIDPYYDNIARQKLSMTFGFNIMF